MDDGSPIGYLITIVLLIFFSAMFAGTEMAFASVSRIRMMSNASNGDKRAKRVLWILDHFDQALTTLLIGNNIVHIGCASIATLMATKLWGVGSVTLATLVTTLVLFFLAETLPKRFAKATSERFAMTMSGTLLFTMHALKPVSFIFMKLSALVSRSMHKDAESEPTVTEDELHDILETAAEEGSLDEEKTELVQNALDFSTTCAKDILTPWKDVETVKTGMRPDEILSLIEQNAHSRLPVLDARGSVIGLLYTRKFLRVYLKNHGAVRLRTVIDPAVFVSPDMPIDDLLPHLSARRTQIAVVRSYEGGLPFGVVTVEDILEELVGEIYDEDDEPAPEEALQ